MSHMVITVIGTGFVGVVSAAVFAKFGHTVYGLDIDEYFRCPYRLSIYEEKGLKPMDLLKSDFIKELIINQEKKYKLSLD